MKTDTKDKKSTTGKRLVKAKSTAADGLRELFVDGLKDSDWVVVAGQQLVREGSIVNAKGVNP